MAEAASKGHDLARIGRLAQLGERCVRNAEVGGSIPPPSTKFNPGSGMSGLPV